MAHDWELMDSIGPCEVEDCKAAARFVWRGPDCETVLLCPKHSQELAENDTLSVWEEG